MPVTTAHEMLTASLAVLPCDIAICAAAVADWAVADAGPSKIKKTDGAPPQLDFVENPDILATISQHSSRPQLVVGFAAETDQVVDYATAKRARKGCDWIVANHVGGENEVFGSDENEVHLVTASGSQLWPRMPKSGCCRCVDTRPLSKRSSMAECKIDIAVLPHGKDLPLPRYATDGAAGMDIAAAVETTLDLAPGERAAIPTGFCLAIPRGYEIQVRPRSGLAINTASPLPMHRARSTVITVVRSRCC